ncbi:proteasome subunit alpha [Streptomyces sp. NPDC052396]|uniref:proteasome subunit alpha n=1 Tax=Streptomyces sp. NPDC052396 TaxID=3365689 RepID=UPI0037D6A030
MSTPFYVSPQQAMADRAEYARKGIARGRSVVVLQYNDGVVFVAENPSRALHKVSEIYDRIAFAAVGKYNEFENLRIGGVRYADLRGYTYDRDDVTARGLANVYAQTLGTIFSSAGEKPYEVELIVAEVGAGPEDDQIYRLPHDGSIVDEHGSVAVGGNADQISNYLGQRHRDGMTLSEALKLAVESLARGTVVGSTARCGASGGAACYQLDRQGRPGRRAFVQHRHQGAHARLAHRLRGQPDGGQFRVHRGGQ